MQQLTYKILMHKEPEGQYTVTVTALPGCVTFGENVYHAIKMAREAIELYIEELQARRLKNIKSLADFTNISY
ncbi:MAG: type II toxin-antitoxin system HicB family antitoxin [Bacteroidota bacterium]